VIKVFRFEDNRIKEALDIATSPLIESVSMHSMRSLIDQSELTSRSNSYSNVTGSQCLMPRSTKMGVEV
jgi:hypothetical protein